MQLLFPSPLNLSMSPVLPQAKVLTSTNMELPVRLAQQAIFPTEELAKNATGTTLPDTIAKLAVDLEYAHLVSALVIDSSQEETSYAQHAPTIAIGALMHRLVPHAWGDTHWLHQPALQAITLDAWPQILQVESPNAMSAKSGIM